MALVILHPDDEIPACRSKQDQLTAFKHENIRFDG